MNKVYCVISHTHWDREWYKPFEVFRMQLTDLINNLLDVIDEYPEYIFHLDAQTVVLEDYLEIYPEKREKLQALIKNGNIIVGPWYLQNDFYLTSGEATIRNLIEGRKIANSFGACSGVGYAPDQFGNISQLPQILSNFGIDNFVFGRGYAPYTKDENGNAITQNTPSEFIWEGADGTKLLAVHLKYWYNNAQRFSADIDKAVKLVKSVEGSFKGVALTPYLLLMNGVDHLEAQEDLLLILQNINNEDINGRINQIKLEDYIADIKTYIKDNGIELSTESGELRKGHDYQVLEGTLSSRSYLKRLNVLAQNNLENRLEPLYSMLTSYGCENIYPQNYIRYAWKKLMQNHPHDSICGCSRDEVHMHMEERYQSIKEITDELLRRGLTVLAQHNGVANKYTDEYSLIAVNTINAIQSGMIEAEINIPITENAKGFDIFDNEGNCVDYALISKTRKYIDSFSPINLPGSIEVDSYRIYMSVPETNGFSMQGYSVRKSDTVKNTVSFIENSDFILENEFIKVTVNQNGSIDITDKQSGKVMNDCIYLEEQADTGDSYLFRSANDTPLNTKGIIPEITITEKNEYKKQCKLNWDWCVPAFYDFEKHFRAEETAEMKAELTLTLKKGDPILEIAYSVDNNAKEHRVRLVVSTNINSDNYIADIPFDIITRKDNEHSPGITSFVHPNTSFAAIKGEDCGVAVFTEGNHESEKINSNSLAFTLFRSNGSISRNADGTLTSGEQWLCPENQCLRNLSGRMGIYMFGANADLPNMSAKFRNPLLSSFTSCNPLKLSGGRAAVQDSDLSEVFIRKDPYAKVEIPNNTAAVAVNCNNAQVTAFKQCENGKGQILRIYYYGETEENLQITAKGNIYKSNMAEQINELLGNNFATIKIAPKKILTLYIEV